MSKYKKQTRDVDFQKWVGARIREIREISGMTQDDFAYGAEIQRGYISDLERGVRNVSISNLKKVCDFFEVRLDDFFDPFYK